MATESITVTEGDATVDITVDSSGTTYTIEIAAPDTGLRDLKESCRVATTANITLSGTQTIDGVAVVANDRVLVKNQTTGSQNGIYVVAAGAWARATDCDANAEVTSGLHTFVTEGITNGNTGWQLTTDDPITVGTTALVFAQFTGGGGVSDHGALTGLDDDDHPHYVKDTGDETIAGVKTFSSAPVVPDASFTIAKTSGLQSALDAKAPANNPTFTGTVTIPDGALAIADTSGLQTALDAKLPLAGGTMTGNLVLNADPSTATALQAATMRFASSRQAKTYLGSDGTGGVFTPEGFDLTSASQTASFAQIATWYLLYVPRRATLAAILGQATTTEAGSTARVGIYTVNDDLYPLALVADYGNLNGANTGLQSVTGSTIVDPGWYAPCSWQSNHASVRWSRLTRANVVPPFGFPAGQANRFIFGWKSAAVDYSAGLPANAPAGLSTANTVSDSNTMHIMVKLAAA